MVSLLKEQENFLRNAILTVDHSKEVLQCFLEQHLKNNHQTFEDFLNQNQHDIYHLYYDAKCCQCGPGPLQKKKRILFASQMELLFDKNRQLSVHKTTRRSDFCCCYAKKNVTTAVLDLTLARCLLMNCCIDMFWYSCLAFKGLTLEQFLNSNKHVLYHLWKNNIKCCKCQPDFIFPFNAPLIMESEWNKMFSSTLPPCENDRKRPVNGAISICAFSATPNITVQHIHLELQGIIIQYCCSTRKSVEKLAELRNLTFGHAKKASMSCTEFNTFMSESEEAIFDIATVCGKEDYYRQMLLDLRDKPLDTRMFRQYEKVLLQTISNYEDIIKENEVLNDGIESLKNSNEEMKEKIEKICILQTEGSKRKRLIDETSAEIEIHKKDVTYVEIEAVRHCIQLLQSRNVVILSGREGSGKSRNGLEILRQVKENSKDFDAFKLIGLTYVSDIVKHNVTSIVLFDDAFDKTCEPFSYDKHILDHLYSHITLNKVKLIFTMRNTVKHACHRLFSTHKLFHDFFDIDLNSETFKLTVEEKKRMLSRYCDVNNIMISNTKELDSDQWVTSEAKGDNNEAIRSMPDKAVVIFKRELMNEIIETDPFLGFPECCRLFTANRNTNHLDASCFKWPSTVLVTDIEKIRIEGINHYMNGLKYVILVLVLTKGYPHKQCQENILKPECSLVKTNINTQDCKDIFKICYNNNVQVHTSDIEHVCKVLTGRYLVHIDGVYYFQHKAIQDSVLISYSRINPEAIIPLLRFDHLVDIVRPNYYTDQEDEIVIKISKPYYSELAKKIFSILNLSDKIDLDRFMESKLITENDIDLFYQLILCIEKYKDTLHVCNREYIGQLIPLYLLRYMGKLDDKMLTVNHTKTQMLISVTIGDKHITLSIDPYESLIKACQSKYEDICIWLLKNTDQSLLDYFDIFGGILDNASLKFLQLLVDNVKHDMINMTDLLIGLCSNQQYSAVDLMLNSVDSSLLCYTDVFDVIINACCYDSIIPILEKVNHKWLNINEVLKKCCEWGCSDVVEWVLKNCDHISFDYEELFKITIDGHEELCNVDQFFCDFTCYNNTLELLILQKPGIICCNINKLFDIANNCRMNGVLELLFKHDINKSIHVDKIIEDIFKHRDDQEEHTMRFEYKNVYYDEEHCQKIIQLIVKYFSNYANVNELIENSFQFGIHDIVELSLEKLDNISYYLDITLDKLRHQKLKGDEICFDTGHGKILLLLLPRINYNSIDLNGVMNDVFHIDHSPAIMWLLENKRSYNFDMRNVMNKACFHGGIKLVEYLYQKYNGEDFDYKTAMLKACRNKVQDTIDVCKWLWKNIDHNIFNMKAALNNASRYGNTGVVEWIINVVDRKLLDTEAAVLCACEHGDVETVQLFFNTSSINMLDIQFAILKACRNEENGLPITKLLYELADQSTFDINAIFSSACKNYRSDIVQWILETCVQRTTENETNDGNENRIKSLEKQLVDMARALSCILNMVAPDQRKRYDNEIKKELIWLILKQYVPKAIYIYELLTESCKKDWVDIFQWILGKVDKYDLNIGEVINVACQNGAYKIVKWSLENVDIQLLDADNVMVESCGFGWLECLVLIQKYCHQYKLHAAMAEACTYGRLDIVKWLLQNYKYKYFNLPLLLKETGRNGWTHILFWLITHFQFYNSDLQIATKEALVNGNQKIVKLMLLVVGRDALDLSTLLTEEFADIKNETVVNFILRNFDLRCLDLGKIMTNACKFGWKKTASFIIDNDSNCLCDSALGLIDISSFITGKHVNCLCDFTSAFNTACMHGEAEIVQLLIANVNHKIFAVQKAMLSTCIKGWDEIAVLLLDNFEHTQLDIGNGLIEACRHGEIYVVQAILRKIKHNLLDIKTALNGACENHMHEDLVLWILKNIDHEQLDLTNVRRKAVRHNWRTVQLEMPEVDIEGFNQIEQETETDYIVIP